MNAQRQAFEAWASNGGKFPAAVERSGDGYRLMSTHSAWVAWQAAVAAMASDTIGFLYADDRETLKRDGRDFVYAERQVFTLSHDPGCVPVFAGVAP